MWEETFDFTAPLCLVLGGEGTGLSRLAQRKVRFVITHPDVWGVSSLNVSVAAGVLLYEVLRRRQGE